MLRKISTKDKDDPINGSKVELYFKVNDRVKVSNSANCFFNMIGTIKAFEIWSTFDDNLQENMKMMFSVKFDKIDKNGWFEQDDLLRISEPSWSNDSL